MEVIEVMLTETMFYHEVHTGIGELCPCMQNPAVLLCYTGNASKPSIMGDDSCLSSDN